jgi:hypothetical protein
MAWMRSPEAEPSCHLDDEPLVEENSDFPPDGKKSEAALPGLGHWASAMSSPPSASTT